MVTDSNRCASCSQCERTWRKKGWNILLKAWNLIKQRGSREESEHSSKQLRSQISVGLKVSADHARWEGSMDQWVWYCGANEIDRRWRKTNASHYRNMCVCVNVYAEWQIFKTINIDKKLENTSTVVATKFDSERAIRLAASEKTGWYIISRGFLQQVLRCTMYQRHGEKTDNTARTSDIRETLRRCEETGKRRALK